MSVDQDILQPWEAECYIQNLQPFKFDEIASKSWFEFHKKLTLLNQQSTLEISTLREEFIKEWFVSYQKIPILIREAIQMELWKSKVFPGLNLQQSELSNTFMLYSLFYHEVVAVSLLENVLFHADSAETLDDTVVDLVDYAVEKLNLLVEFGHEVNENDQNNEEMNELLSKKSEMEFDIRIKCISILRYLAEFVEKLPLCVLSRMLTVHDVPYLLVVLIEMHPWKKMNENDEPTVYDNGRWEKVNDENADKLCRVEGQIWLGLRELLLNPICRSYYELTEFRKSNLMKLQKYLQEHVLDQIAPLIELRQWLSYLNMSAPTPNSNSKLNLTVEVVPQIKSSIKSKYCKKWKKLQAMHAEYLCTKDIEKIKNIAQILGDAYNMDKLDMVKLKVCARCKEQASKKCSICKEVWYCGRECQVKDWPNHKDVCPKIIESKKAFGINE